MKNVKFEKLKETVKGEKYYLLFKMSSENKLAYCIAIEDEGLSVQGLGNDFNKAMEMYEIISCGEVSEEHLNDAVRDMQIEIFA